MREEVHLHRKAVGNLSLGFLSTYLLHASFFGGVQLILNRGSITITITNTNTNTNTSTSIINV